MNGFVLEISKLNKYFGSLHVLNDISLNVEQGEFITLLGPSGCGKTTLLRTVAGLESVLSGSILLSGQAVTNLEPNKRNVNTVFQNYALFPHMNVYDNIAYGPKIRKKSKDDIKKSVSDMLKLVQMEGYESRFSHQLSGGQCQRIAIARALVNSPDILLLDEPLGALDLKLRKHMQTELKRIQKQTGIAFIYVTHDQEEALNMSDRIAVMNGGVIEQIGKPDDIYNKPETLFVAQFVGERNLIPVQLLEYKETHAVISVAGNPVYACLPKDRSKEGYTLAVHQDRIRFSKEKTDNSLPVIVLDILVAGSRTVVTVSANGLKLVGLLYNSAVPFAAGDKIFASFDIEAGLLLNDADADSTVSTFKEDGHEA